MIISGRMDLSGHLARPLVGEVAGRPPEMPWVAAVNQVDAGLQLTALKGLSQEESKSIIGECQVHLEAQGIEWVVAEKKEC